MPMKNSQYKPSPVDVSGIVLPERLTALTEDIARNVHEVWALNRIEQGWTYGEVRNDRLKQHPCITDYDSLTEDEKNMDRETALTTLKLIYRLGFEIIQKNG